MIENSKTEVVEEETKLEETKSFVKIGAFIIGGILLLMVICIIMIVLLENDVIVF